MTVVTAAERGGAWDPPQQRGRTVGDRAPREDGPQRWFCCRNEMQKRVLLAVHAVPDGDLGCVRTAGVEACVSTLGVYWGTAGG